MLIDWFTVIAQAVNFLILVWLMKRFLYKPILAAIDAREQRIADAQAEAEVKVLEAAAERAEFQRRNEEFDRQRDEMFGQAASAADAEHRRLFEEVRQEADEMRDKLHAKLDGEFRALHEEITRRTQAEVVAIVRKTLADLADASLEQRMVEVFLRHLQEMGGHDRERLAAAYQGADAAVVVRSAFELAEPQRGAIAQAVKATLAIGNPLQFEVVPGLVGGIELLLRGEKVAWSISNHLASLEKELAVLLKAH